MYVSYPHRQQKNTVEELLFVLLFWHCVWITVHLNEPGRKLEKQLSMPIHF